MSIDIEVLGRPGRDNCALVRIDSGQSIDRLLFDCGANCLDTLSVAEIQSIDHLFFSHFHMDHVAGFDAFFRCNYNRDAKPNRLWGPIGSCEILQHRFQGYWWNLTERETATWRVTEIAPDAIASCDYRLSEGFATPRNLQADPHCEAILDDRHWTVDAMTLRHRGASLAYRVREKPKQNVDVQAIKEMGLSPGPWLKTLKDPASTDSAGGDATLEIDGRVFRLSELRDRLLVATPGQSFAYATDFLLDDATHATLAEWLRGVDTLVCEAQYHSSDEAHAERNHHATTRKVGRLARDANVGQLVLFHLSDRYDVDAWRAMLGEAKAEHPNTRFPANWNDAIPDASPPSSQATVRP